MVIKKSAVVTDTMIQQPDPLSPVKALISSYWRTATDRGQPPLEKPCLIRVTLPEVTHNPSQISHNTMLGGACRNKKACLVPYPNSEEQSELQRSPLRSSVRLNQSPTFPSAQSCFFLLLSFPSTGGNPKSLPNKLPAC